MNNSQLFAVSSDKKRAKEFSSNEQECDKKPSAQELEQQEIEYARLGFNEPIER
jgi:hypothetical protein